MENEIKDLIIAALSTHKYDDIVEKYAAEHLEMHSDDDIAEILRNGSYDYILEDIFYDWVNDNGLVDPTDIPFHIRSGDYDEVVENRFNKLYDNTNKKVLLKQRESILDKIHQEMHPNSVLGYKYCGHKPCRTWDDVI